ncbi:MAG: LPS assembly lipoprotein LptE [Thiobacillus sp.]|nr:LPS assembly lipoprotein LptE [Thiobacillus sp.]
MNRRLFLALVPAALAAGCGFQLRASDGVPFASLYLDAPPGSAVAARLRTLLTVGNKTRLTATADEAEAVLKLSSDVHSKTILSLSGAGRVTEYRLGLRVEYGVFGRDGRVLAETEVIELRRDLTYDDKQVLAKGAEETLLYRDMDENAALRILRRLQALKPANGRS